jgi:hypothetical protein
MNESKLIQRLACRSRWWFKPLLWFVVCQSLFVLTAYLLLTFQVSDDSLMTVRRSGLFKVMGWSYIAGLSTVVTILTAYKCLSYREKPTGEGERSNNQEGGQK